MEKKIKQLFCPHTEGLQLAGQSSDSDRIARFPGRSRRVLCLPEGQSTEEEPENASNSGHQIKRFQ